MFIDTTKTLFFLPDGVFSTEHIEEIPGNVFDMAKVILNRSIQQD